MPTLDAEDIRWVREGGFEPGATHAHRACLASLSVK